MGPALVQCVCTSADAAPALHPVYLYTQTAGINEANPMGIVPPPPNTPQHLYTARMILCVSVYASAYLAWYALEYGPAYLHPYLIPQEHSALGKVLWQMVLPVLHLFIVVLIAGLGV